MARVIYGGGVSEFVGSIGGTTYQSNGSGFIARQKPIYRQRKTTTQSEQNSNFTYLSQRYRSLDNAKKLSWVDFAFANTFTDFFNRVKILNGIQFYIMQQHYSVLTGNGYFSTAPTYVAPISSNTFSITYILDELLLTTASTFGSGGSYLLIFSTPPITSETAINRRLFRSTIIPIDSYISVLDITTAWENTHGLNYNDTVFNTDMKIRCAATLLDNTCLIPSPFVFNS